MTPDQALQSIGLTQKEATIYLSCLELGHASITHIAKKSTIKRPTVYVILESLEMRGLVNTTTQGKRTLYGVEEPHKLVGLLAEKQRSLQTVLPFLTALNNRSETKPKVRFYEGVEGLKRIYEEMFQTTEMRFWGSIEFAETNLPELVGWFIKLAKNNKMKIFDILADTPKNRAYAKKVTRKGYEIRFFPKEACLQIDSMLSGNKLSLCTYAPQPHGLIIESETMANSFKMLWQLAWEGAKKYNP
jgi:sugar-specific transcriptional regulator TrmB